MKGKSEKQAPVEKEDSIEGIEFDVLEGGQKI